jgi:hypothetical protein
MVHAGSSAKHIGSPPILPEPGHDKNYLLQNYEIIANLLSPPKKMSPLRPHIFGPCGIRGRDYGFQPK